LNELIGVEFNTVKTSIGRIYSGQIFLHENRLWIAINPVPHSSGKLIASLFEGRDQENKVLPAKTEILLIEKYSIKNETRITK